MRLKTHTIQNTIAVQIGKNTFIVQGKRLTENKLIELYILSSKVMQKQGLIADYKTRDPRPYIQYIRNWLIKGNLELFADKTALINDVEIDNTDTIFYSSKITVTNHAILDIA
jgi:hypothetical protein